LQIKLEESTKKREECGGAVGEELQGVQ